jgi:hypothetical protein
MAFVETTENQFVNSLAGSMIGASQSFQGAERQKAMSLLEEAVQSVAAAVGGTSKTAGLLCGQDPVKNQAATGQKITSGVFDRIEQLAQQLRESAAAINENMSRIQGRL